MDWPEMVARGAVNPRYSRATRNFCLMHLFKETGKRYNWTTKTKELQKLCRELDEDRAQAEADRTGIKVGYERVDVGDGDWFVRKKIKKPTWYMKKKMAGLI